MKQGGITLTALSCAAAVGLTVGILGERAAMRSAAPQEQQPVAQSTADAAKARYRLASKDGKIAVYIMGKTEPELIFDIYLHHLPDVDRQRLEQGIEIEDYQQLLTLIEDYTS